MQHREPARELRFQLLAEIAAGSTARVELCRIVAGSAPGRLCAVKRLHPQIAEDPGLLAMFRDEAWLTSALKHEHIVEVLGWGTDAQVPWLAVELVRGVSLARLMKTVFETGEMFTERMVVFIARSICRGLAEAHALRSPSGEHLNLVHRDLTPGNVLLGFSGEVKIADFGLAKAKQRLTRTLTGLLKGNPHYMSPEQVNGDSLDGRSDIFALGVLLFELFSGRRPWAAQSDLDVMRAVTSEPATDLLELRPKLDRALAEIAARCLEKDPVARFSGAGELAQRFDGWLGAHGYQEGNENALGRFVRRNAMRQMRWFERAVAGEFAARTRAEALPGDRFDAAREGDGAGEARLDWGEEGPTLIQRSQQAQQLIAELVPASQREGGPEHDTTTKRPAKAAAAARKAKPEGPSLTPSTLSRRGEPAPHPATRARRDADATAQLADGPKLVRGALGVVAPHDPDVPPLPGAEAPRDSRHPFGETVTNAVPSASFAPGMAPPAIAPDGLSMPTMPLDGVALPLQPTPAAAQAALIPAPPPAPPAPSAPSLISPQPLPSESMGALGEPPSVAPAFAPATDSNLLAADADFAAEATRLADAALRADASARHAGRMAAAAARAAKLASQAVALAGRGLRAEAAERLAEARRFEQLLATGEVPSRRPLASDRLVGGIDPWFERRVAFVRQQLHGKRAVTIAVLAAAAALLLVVLIVLVAL